MPTSPHPEPRQDPRDGGAVAEPVGAARDRILGIVSHDLRAPLATISMMLARLEGEPEMPAAERSRILRLTRRSVEWMRRMINDLLDVTSIEAGRLSITPGVADVTLLLTRAYAMFEESFEEAGVKLALDVPEFLPPTILDEERILQAVGNLLGNAVKFTPKGGSVMLSGHSDDGDIVITVRDDGPGVPSDRAPYLFDRAWQAEGVARARGAGLGLGIAKGIVDAHGGWIGLERGDDGGSTFVIRLRVGGPAVPG